MADMDFTQVDLAMDEVWRLHPAKAQFNRLGNTAKWFRPRTTMFKGKRWNFKAYTTPPSGVRGNTFAAGTDIDFEYPTASRVLYTELSYDRADMTFFAFSLEMNEFADAVTADPAHAVYGLASKLIKEASFDMGNSVNRAIHQSNAGKMGTVAAKYASTGATYSTSTAAFIQITDTQIGKFHKGMILDVGPDEVTINDVIRGQDGPWPTGGANVPVANIGPGLIITATTVGDLDTVAADDVIYMSDEGTTGEGLAGFPSWFDGATNVYNDADGSAIDRDAVGNSWSIPTIEIIAASGSEETLDLEEHLGRLADVLPQIVEFGRKRRDADQALTSEDAIVMGGAMVGITSVKLANSAVRDGNDTARFTKTMDMDQDMRTKLFGQVSFDGVVFHSPTMPPIALQADVAADTHKIRIIDPQSWGVLALDSESNSMQAGLKWLKSGGAAGTRFTRIMGTNNRATNRLTASGYSLALLFSDQPQANAEIRGVKSWRE